MSGGLNPEQRRRKQTITRPRNKAAIGGQQLVIWHRVGTLHQQMLQH